MNAKTLDRAIKEARRFLTIAVLVKATSENESYFGPSRETGAVKLASMDLTRALADMRRPL